MTNPIAHFLSLLCNYGYNQPFEIGYSDTTAQAIFIKENDVPYLIQEFIIWGSKLQN